MNKTVKAFSILLLAVLCLSTISLAEILPDELEKIEAAVKTTKAKAVPAAPRIMLVYSRGKGHVHTSIPHGAKAIELMGEHTGAYEVVHSMDPNSFKPGNLKQFDAICFNNSNRMDFFKDPALQESLLDYAKSGKGIVGVHAATTNFTEKYLLDWPEGVKLLGGSFAGHPWNAKGTWAVKIDKPKHPLMRSFEGKGYKINEEIYRIDCPACEELNVLMSLDMSDEATANAKGATPEDKDNPISWTKSYGKGKVFYCSLGHNHHIFWNEAILQHYLDGIQYALGDLKLGAGSKKRVKVAVVTGGHKFEEEPFLDIFKANKRIDFTHVPLEDDSEIFEETSDWRYDVIVFYNMTQQISEKRKDNFLQLLKQGVGVVSLHHNMAAFELWPEYEKIIGVKYHRKKALDAGLTDKLSSFKHDVNYDIHVEDKEHFITQGLSDFSVFDETYKDCTFEADNHVLLSTDEETNDKQIAWTRKYKKARVCTIMPGHGTSIYADKNYRMLIARAIEWCAKPDRKNK